MKNKIVNGGSADENLYVVFADVREAMPYYLRANYSKVQLIRQRYNSEFFLPYHRARTHHAPHFWRVADLLRWFENFPLPPGDYDSFARELRARASATPPTKPSRPSAAGNHPREKVA